MNSKILKAMSDSAIQELLLQYYIKNNNLKDPIFEAYKFFLTDDGVKELFERMHYLLNPLKSLEWTFTSYMAKYYNNKSKTFILNKNYDYCMAYFDDFMSSSRFVIKPAERVESSMEKYFKETNKNMDDIRNSMEYLVNNEGV